MSKAKSVMGHDLMLWVGGKVIACSKSCKLSFKASSVDSETKDDGEWDAKEIASRGCTISNESLYSADKNRSVDLVFRDLYKLFLSNEPIEFTCGIVQNKNAAGIPEGGWKAPTSDYLKGKAVFTSLDLDASKGSKASMSVNMESFGAVELVEAE